MVDIASLFIGFNVYAFIVAHLTRMFSDHHGLSRGFVIGNVVLGLGLVFLLFSGYLLGTL